MSGTTNIESMCRGKNNSTCCRQAPPPGFEPGPKVPKTRVLPLHQGGMCANASDTYARLRSAMPIQPVFADWIPGPIPWPITADRLADGARVELAGGFRPNSLSRTAPLPHGPPSHAGVCDSGAHRPNLDRSRMGRFMRDSRSGEDSNLRGLAPLLLSGQSHSTALPPLH